MDNSWQVDEKPDWAPLERVLTPAQCENYMHMGKVGTIQLYKHRDTRQYLNIDSVTGAFYRYTPEEYIPVDPDKNCL